MCLQHVVLMYLQRVFLGLAKCFPDVLAKWFSDVLATYFSDVLATCFSDVLATCFSDVLDTCCSDFMITCLYQVVNSLVSIAFDYIYYFCIYPLCTQHINHCINV